jgi:hypothetical protein
VRPSTCKFLRSLAAILQSSHQLLPSRYLATSPLLAVISLSLAAIPSLLSSRHVIAAVCLLSLAAALSLPSSRCTVACCAMIDSRLCRLTQHGGLFTMLISAKIKMYSKLQLLCMIHSSSTTSRQVWVNPNVYTCGYNPSGGARCKPNLSRVEAKPSGGAAISHWQTLAAESNPNLTFLQP